MRKLLSLVVVLCVLAAPACADEFTAIERGAAAGRIIHGVSSSAYLTKTGTAITEEMISGITSADYVRTGLVADGNSRIILRYKSDTPGTVAFSVSPSISGAKLESLTTRQELTAPIAAASTTNGYQASAVFIAPEAWPANITYPSGTFTVTATFTPENGTATSESLTLTLQAPPVVLIHGAFCDNERMFGYTTTDKRGVWHSLLNAGLSVVSWNYDNTKAPKALISSNTNGLASIIADTLKALTAKGISATRVDLVTHSSGGIVARQYLRTDTDTGNDTPNSYGQGTVRRVVTIASPNQGTPIASYVAGKFSTLPQTWQNWPAKTWWEGLGWTLLKMFALKNVDITESMTDLSISSEYLAALGYPGVPFHAIYGKVKDDEWMISKLFDDIVNKNVVSLSQIDWLPQRLLDNLTGDKLAMVSGVLSAVSDDIRFRELLSVLHNNEDHDLVVSEPSAKDIFPSNALTSFTGLKTHSHLTIGQQNDVGERVIALLKGGTENFMINTASSTNYNAALDAVEESFAATLRASAEGDLSEYLDVSMLLEASDPEDEYMGADESEPVIQSVELSGGSALGFSDDIYVVLEDDGGMGKFFKIAAKDLHSFDVNVWADREAKGLYNVWYFTIQNGKLKISPTLTVAYVPKFSEDSTPVLYWAKTIYAHVGEEVHAGLIVEAEGSNYDISAPDLGVVSYTVSDTSIAEITSTGRIRALKEGSTTIRATAYGHTVSTTFTVRPAGSVADTTRDIGVTGGSSVNPGSSAGGCDSGFGVMAVLSVLGLMMKRR